MQQQTTVENDPSEAPRKKQPTRHQLCNIADQKLNPAVLQMFTQLTSLAPEPANFPAEIFRQA